jgi:hypothetical protein
VGELTQMAVSAAMTWLTGDRKTTPQRRKFARQKIESAFSQIFLVSQI